ncbi:hypothetical protein U1Q18_044981 [Sarracenia purpurea var. burkii]
MDAESFAKVAAKTAASDPACSGSKPLNPKQTPPSSSPSSTAAPASSTSSTQAPITSAPEKKANSFVDIDAEIFRSLLYEACGRIVNPIYGSVGLLWSGNWALCQNAVDAVLKGAPITQIASEAAACDNGPSSKGYDIRHVSNGGNPIGSKALHRVKTRCRFKKTVVKAKTSRVCTAPGYDSGHDELNPSTSHGSSLSHQSERAADAEGESREAESLASADTAEPDSDPQFNEAAGDGEFELELTLGFEPIRRSQSVNSKRDAVVHLPSNDGGACRMELGLHFPA